MDKLPAVGRELQKVATSAERVEERWRFRCDQAANAPQLRAPSNGGSGHVQRKRPPGAPRVALGEDVATLTAAT
jgi:hypothetical protein